MKPKKASSSDLVSLRLEHATPKRLRYSFKYTGGAKPEPLALQIAIESLEGIKSARVNLAINNIILEVAGIVASDINDSLKEILEHVILHGKARASKDSCIVLREEIPSSSGVVRAGTSLILEPFLKNSNAKLGAAVIGSTPIVWDGVKELFSHGLTSKVLEAMAVAISIYRKDFRAANSASFMLSLGEYIEEATVYKSDDLIKELSKPQVEEVWLEKHVGNRTETVLVPISEVKPGDIVVVGAGEIVAVDGHVMNGEAMLNQISMTGEAEPVRKGRGDRVLSGTVVEEGRIKVWAEHVGDETTTARIKNYIQSSLEEKSSLQLEASKMADGLVPITLGLALTSYAISRDLTRLASVLQADYSCALKLATPVAFKSSIGSAGKMGIIIKGAKSLEALHSVDTFVFDKTGTLTKGELEVIEVHSFSSDWDETTILNLAASAEEHYFHPVAQAIVKAAKERDFVHMHHDEVEFIVAHGVKTEVNGKSVVIGSRHFLEDDEMIDFSSHQLELNNYLSSGFMPLYIGYDRELLGVIMLKDEVRPNAAETLKQLKKCGVKEIVMLTGDSTDKAKEVAESIGVDRYFAELLPTQKAEILEKLIAEGKKVAFVGDGINDAPALMKAHAGIGMHNGADIAKASADVVLLRDDISAVAEAKEIANATLEKVHTNFKATLGINSAILGAAALGWLSPVRTALLHNGTTIGLLLSALNGVKVKNKKEQ
ncbi:MAG: heavy metal translocating P-type ATPase [Wolinella sp.]